MLGSLKNSTSVKSPNFLCSDRSKNENARNQILTRQKDVPFNGELSYPPFADDMWRYIEKIRSPSFCRCIVSSSQVSSDIMLYFFII